MLQTKEHKDFRKQIFDIIQIGDKSNFFSRAFDVVIVINILLNITVTFMDTFEELANYHWLFRYIEIGTTIFFIIEYLLRIWTADYLYKGSKLIMARIKFILSYDGIVDLLTILPAFFLSGFVVLRMLRVVRIFHLFRINSRYDSFHVIRAVFIEKKNQIASAVFIVLILMLASSLCMYSVEHEAQPEAFKNAFSGMWWSVSCLLTVGYGDIYPITVVGQIMAIVIAFLGVGVVAIPTGIISAGFVEQYQRKAEIAQYKKTDIKQVAEVVVDNTIKGKTVIEANRICRIEIILIIRDDLSILPKDDIILKNGDILIIQEKEIS